MKAIRNMGKRPHDLKRILLTHSHPDHMSGVWKLRRETGAAVVAHEGDTRTRGDGVTLSYLGFMGSVELGLPFLHRALVDVVLRGSDHTQAAPGFTAIPTPGHTRGSVCYLLEDRATLFTGDTAFSDGRRVSRSLPFPGTDRQAYRRSFEELSRIGFDVLCGGHGIPLVGNASEALVSAVVRRPEPPSWIDLPRSVGRRMFRGKKRVR
jgi:glyoxylase-like metal-dependent hydrolase (beta-lactamase superfamily II)